MGGRRRSGCYALNPDALDFIKAHVIVAPVVEARCFAVGVSGHALRSLDAPAIFEVIGDARGAEGCCVIEKRANAAAQTLRRSLAGAGLLRRK